MEVLSKQVYLKQFHVFNPQPKNVIAPLFLNHDFFDAHDKLQIKYEMLRHIDNGALSSKETALQFGYSRTALYQIREQFSREGLAGLLPHRTGPHQAKKLTAQVIEFIQQKRCKEHCPWKTIATMLYHTFGYSLHIRTMQQAIAQQEKKHSHSRSNTNMDSNDKQLRTTARIGYPKHDQSIFFEISLRFLPCWYGCLASGFISTNETTRINQFKYYRSSHDRNGSQYD